MVYFYLCLLHHFLFVCFKIFKNRVFSCMLSEKSVLFVVLPTLTKESHMEDLYDLDNFLLKMEQYLIENTPEMFAPEEEESSSGNTKIKKKKLF